ncbi:uncharacterized protein N0V89_008628 [Didymosphaeria variabile]|uniref:Uncharacterized protein n=1 Tax=Didymosphaeria variabile TaxID=1932322 RepID=A0A9W8XH37_9PLEO|nr:uncharacterized protein N0V89_008628 [Didymosphaeria variabile]KAJ4350007.1 hypothetical protein N0V89_008628 [Didymosphaeria variabile]
MPSHNLRVFLCLTPSLLVLAFSGLIIVLERITQSLLRSHTTRNFRDGSAGITSPGTDLTVNEDYAPTWALLGVGVLGALFACMSAAGMWELRRVDGRRGAGQRIWCWGVLCMNAVMLGVSVGVLAWASSLQAAQSGVNMKEDKAYSRETWLCRIDALYTDQDWAASACGTAKSTRFMLIPVAIGSILAIIAVWFAAKPRGGTSWLVGGKGRYGGFQSVYEMGPQGPPPQYQHAPPQFYPMSQAHPQQQGNPQPGYAMPPQGFRPEPYQPPPGSYAPAPQMQKGGAVVGDPALFRT